ncbi:hypothetical protein L1281_000842 [Neisseria sp. HSC-16F19]|nr:FixH family protein [Neisseria sp. HSC-16F19]MCP2040260.1 hypothetical protein [Neisseria sp. HSC-16F19]
MRKNDGDKRPWYKEPWPWLLAAGPVIVVIAGFITLYIAITRGDSVVKDDYYKDGKHFELSTERDSAAQQRGIHAQILLNEAGDHARILLSGDVDPAVPLQLLWIHPTQEQWDQTATLTPVTSADNNQGGAQIYDAAFAPLQESEHWYVRIEDAQQQWRVQSNWVTEEGRNITLDAQRQQQLPQRPKAN